MSVQKALKELEEEAAEAGHGQQLRKEKSWGFTPQSRQLRVVGRCPPLYHSLPPPEDVPAKGVTIKQKKEKTCQHIV